MTLLIKILATGVCLFAFLAAAAGARAEYEKATFAGDALVHATPFEKLDGVTEVLSVIRAVPARTRHTWYAQKGHIEVSTDHFRSVQRYPILNFLESFWRQIDPTDAGGQFVDRGPRVPFGDFSLMRNRKNWLKARKPRSKNPADSESDRDRIDHSFNV